VANPASRLIFANNILATFNHYNLDGIDIDWEYPGQPGHPDNIVDPAHDTVNYLAFLQLLRTVLPADAKISAAALSQPWAGSNGRPLADMGEFAAVLDWVLVMNYDVWGSSATPGPNAPLSDGCGNSTQPVASAEGAVRAWTNAGFPANRLVLGLPAYGYISNSRAVFLHGRSTSVLFPGVGNQPAATTEEPIVIKNEEGGTVNGQVQFRELVRQGALRNRFDLAPAAFKGLLASFWDTPFDGAHGYTRFWDRCSSTPFLRSTHAGQVITYDDPESVGMKAKLAREFRLKGVNMFDVHGDTDNWDLTDAAIRSLLWDLD
jgi:chitinase